MRNDLPRTLPGFLLAVSCRRFARLAIRFVIWGNALSGSSLEGPTASVRLELVPKRSQVSQKIPIFNRPVARLGSRSTEQMPLNRLLRRIIG